MISAEKIVGLFDRFGWEAEKKSDYRVTSGFHENDQYFYIYVTVHEKGISVGIPLEIENGAELAIRCLQVNAKIFNVRIVMQPDTGRLVLGSDLPGTQLSYDTFSYLLKNLSGYAPKVLSALTSPDQNDE